VPALRAGIVNVPFSALTVVDSAAVATFLALMSAPGMTAPDASVTVPVIELVAPPCAYASVPAMAIITVKATGATSRVCFMKNPPPPVSRNPCSNVTDIRTEPSRRKTVEDGMTPVGTSPPEGTRKGDDDGGKRSAASLLQRITGRPSHRLRRT